MSNAGSNVRLIRQQVGMSLRAVAEASGIDPATLSRIENGKQKLTEDFAYKLGAVVHVSPSLFFTDPASVESAVLRMRKVPLLTASQLASWTGPDTFEEGPDQVYLYCSIQTCSRESFALSIEDLANEPQALPDDKIIFDSTRTPRFGELVAAQTEGGPVLIGSYRECSDSAGFDLVPLNRLFPIISFRDDRLALRGVRAEQRRTF